MHPLTQIARRVVVWSVFGFVAGIGVGLVFRDPPAIMATVTARQAPGWAPRAGL